MGSETPAGKHDPGDSSVRGIAELTTHLAILFVQGLKEPEPAGGVMGARAVALGAGRCADGPPR